MVYVPVVKGSMPTLQIHYVNLVFSRLGTTMMFGLELMLVVNIMNISAHMSMIF